MNCRDFERGWNVLIDGEADAATARSAMGAVDTSSVQPGLVLAERERALLEHAAQCSACSQVGARYQALRRAIRNWAPPPAPSVELADRILAEVQEPAPSAWAIYGRARREPIWPVVAAMSTVAAALVLAITLVRSLNQTRPNGTPAVAHVTGVDPGHHDGRVSETAVVNSRSLNVALAEATEATWDLAKSASEPAARISQQMLGAATEPDQRPAQPIAVTGTEPTAAALSVPSLDSLTPDAAAAAAMLQQVGDRLATGVRPLSDTARHAFGFLLGPVIPKPELPINPPAQKGA